MLLRSMMLLRSIRRLHRTLRCVETPSRGALTGQSPTLFCSCFCASSLCVISTIDPAISRYIHTSPALANVWTLCEACVYGLFE